MINELAQHLVDKGHFGYLPMPALTKSRAEDKGQTQGVRLEFNEPRSYFDMSPALKQCMTQYKALLARKIELLSDPEQLGNLFKIYKPDETDEHKALYDAAYEQMLKEAMELVKNIRNDRYTADKVAFDKNCVKILAKPIGDFSGECVEGFALDKKNQEYQQGKQIMLYISTKDGKVKISTIFPGNTLAPLKEKVEFLKANTRSQESNK